MEQSRLLCPIVEGQQCPPELLAQLRAIDPTAELIHFGGGDWRLGAVNPTDTRTRDGELMLKTMQEEKDFRARDFAWRKDQGQSVFERRLAVTNGDEARAEHDAQMREFIRTDGRSHYRREIRNRVQFGFGGMTGGSGRIILP